MRLTDWIPGTQKPVRKGIYERYSEYDEIQDYAKWDGRRWMCGQATPEKADSLVMVESMFQPHHGNSNFVWRGILKGQK